MFKPINVENYSKYVVENISSPVFVAMHGLKMQYIDRLDIVEELQDEMNISMSEAFKRLLHRSIANMNVNLDYEFPLAETAIEILGCISLAKKLSEVESTCNDVSSNSLQDNNPPVHQPAQFGSEPEKEHRRIPVAQELSQDKEQPQTTEIVFILDRSGSMAGLESDTIGGYNAMLSQWQEKNLPIFLSTVLFDHEQLVIHNRERIADVRPLTANEYSVRGSTALLDAVGGAINHTRRVHALLGGEKPEHTIFVITTDGYENASHKYTLSVVRKLVENQKRLGWEFIFLGANIDAVGVAGSLGISADKAVNVVHDGLGMGTSFMGSAIFCTNTCLSRPNTNGYWRRKIDEYFKLLCGKR